MILDVTNHPIMIVCTYAKRSSGKARMPRFHLSLAGRASISRAQSLVACAGCRTGT